MIYYCSEAYGDAIHPSIADKVEEIRRVFGEKNLAILSNSVGSCDDENYTGAVKTEKTMRIDVIRHKLKKPACLKEVLDHFQKVYKQQLPMRRESSF